MSTEPLAYRIRPQSLNQIVGQEHLLSKDAPLRKLIETDSLTSVILYGPPGTGKTTIAEVIANTTNAMFVHINATTAGKSDMKTVVQDAQNLKETENRKTIMFVDEIHRFNKAQQDYLLPFVENGLIVLIGATTENPFFEINHALISRSTIYELKPLTSENIVTILNSALNAATPESHALIRVENEILQTLADASDGDARHALNLLQHLLITTPVRQDENGDDVLEITEAELYTLWQLRQLRYDKDGDQHYDMISAYIESVKHSHVSAGLYYLARMLKAGEDPKYIARRIAMIASEDIGLADPNALSVAASTITIVDFTGMPECAKTLALATVYMATALKSNSAVKAYAKAEEDVEAHGNLTIPAFLQDASYKSAYKLGRGVGCADIHANQYHYWYQQCMPEEIKNNKYYFPGSQGYENLVVKRNLSMFDTWLKDGYGDL